jgi:pimeloyl-ACP methyl ester carboxylesterase
VLFPVRMDVAIPLGLDPDERARRIGVPTLVIGGADDPATPPDIVREIADGVPGAEFAAVQNAAHLVNAEQPEIVTDALAAHLAAA